MSLDQYEPCICGCGRKLRFCAPKKWLRDLPGIWTLLEKGQPQAALQQTESLLNRHGLHPILLVLKAGIQLETDDAQGPETVRQLLKLAPYNPMAHILAANVAGLSDDWDTMMGHLQTALENQGEHMPAMFGLQLIQSAGTICESWESPLVALALMPALAPWTHRGEGFARGVMEVSDLVRRGLRSVASLLVNLIVEHNRALENTSLPEETREIVANSLSNGLWRRGLAHLQSKADEQDSSQLAYWKAYFATCLRDEQAADHWLAYAERPDVDDTHAQIAVALAIDLDPLEDELRGNYRLGGIVEDVDGLSERLLSDPKCLIDPDAAERFEGVRLLAILCDRPLLPRDDTPTVENVPRRLGWLVLTRKSLRQPARLQIEAIERTKDGLDDLKALAREIAGDFVSEWDSQLREELSLFDTLSPPVVNREAEDALPPERAAAWDAVRTEVLLGDVCGPWLKEPRERLGQQSLWDARHDPEKRRLVEGTLMKLRIGLPRNQTRCWTAVRSHLELAPEQPLEPDVVKLWPALAYRVEDFSEFTADEMLSIIDSQLPGRDSEQARRWLDCLEPRADQLQEQERVRWTYGTYVLTIDPTSSADQIRTDFATARRRADRCAHQDRGRMLVQEMTLRAELGTHADKKEFSNLFSQLLTEYREDTEVMGELIQLLQRLGMVDENGRPVAMPDAPGEPPEESSKIWTPDADSPSSPAAPGEEQSKLWLPGMD